MHQVWCSTGQGKARPGPRFRRIEDAIRFVNGRERGSYAIKAPDGTFHKWPDGNVIVAKGTRRGSAALAPSEPVAQSPSRPPVAEGTMPPRPVAVASDPGNRRKFPRIDFDGDGELELRAGEGEATSLPCTVVSIAPSGIGCLISRGALPGPGTKVTARFSDGQRKFELVGRVAWSGGQAERARGVGVALQLELTPAAIRREYAHWVIGKLRTSY
jgi:hypothetical protein